jgi:hypothetical protein
MPGLGRIYRPDDRDLGFLMSRKIPDEAVAATGARLWPMPMIYDQGETPACTGFSSSGAMTALAAGFYNATVVFDAAALYAWANAHDGDSTPHDGSTVRAALKGLATVGDQVTTSTDVKDQSVGMFDKLQNYLWADPTAPNADIDRLITWILTVSPVVIGIDWSTPMFTPGPDGYVHPDQSKIEGGHAIMIRGVNANDPAHTYFCLRNSWDGWGVTVKDDWTVDTSPPGGGDALLSKADLVMLLENQGEAGALVENLSPIAPTPPPAPGPIPSPSPGPTPGPAPNPPAPASIVQEVEAVLKRAWEEIKKLLGH